MKLDEAIQHCKEHDDCTPCGQEHKQLRIWLEELKDLRTRYKIPTPHGDLIDKEKVKELLLDLWKTGKNYTIADIIREIVDIPTIIEAEGKS